MPRVNFQIQYFEEEYKDKFKAWAHKKKLTMKELLEQIIDNEKEINELIKK